MLNPGGPDETKEFKFAENVPSILGESFEETDDITFGILPAAPKDGLNKAEPLKDEFASLSLLVQGTFLGGNKMKRETKGREEQIRNPIPKKKSTISRKKGLKSNKQGHNPSHPVKTNLFVRTCGITGMMNVTPGFTTPRVRVVTQ